MEKEIFNEGNRHSVSAGLLTYPTLMAGDIIIHKAVKVPVGKDQEQNMEMARRFARRFNSTFEVDFFPEPASFHLTEKAVKVPGLDGSGKMGKSEGNAIYLIDDEKAIKKKVMKAVTDAGPTEPNSVKPEPIANLFAMMDIVSTKDTYDFFNEKYNNCEAGRRYQQLLCTDPRKDYRHPFQRGIHGESSPHGSRKSPRKRR